MSNYNLCSDIVNTRAIQDGWIAFAEKLEPWELFGHFTFPNYPTFDFADRIFKRFINRANKALYGSHYSRKGLGMYWLRGTEYQKRGSLHFHALMSGYKVRHINTPEGRKVLMKIWEDTSPEAGFARIYPFRSGAKVYASKYVTKDVSMDFFVSPRKLGQLQTIIYNTPINGLA
jgi:hypothetical protein